MKIAIIKEGSAQETRVAASSDSVAKYCSLGFKVGVERGAGIQSSIVDADFKAAGATIAASRAAVLKDADIVLCVQRPSAASLKGIKKGALVIGMLDPYGAEKDIAALARLGVDAFSMEFMPRITRAQSMDVLSSQANLAGYQAVIDGSAAFDRAMPMMMTAAGTVRPAKVFVMGAGVAGLQAIATARRLGAVVTATDVRPVAKEQVESLGAKFIAVDNEEFREAETAGGYAKQMSPAYQKLQAELTASHIAKQDIVITTALIPGRPAPMLISKKMVEAMAPGSVIVDLAVERGGNCEVSKAGAVVDHKGVKVVGYHNVPGRIPASASQFYAKNLSTFVETLIDKESGALSVSLEDELVAATLLTHEGKIIHPNFVASKSVASKSAASKPAAKKAPAKKAPVKSAPAKKAPVKRAPAKKAPAKKAVKKPAAKARSNKGAKT